MMNKKLEALSISSNQLTSLNASLFAPIPQLQTLILSNNKIQKIERLFLESLKNLSLLILSKNDCVDESFYGGDLKEFEAFLSECFDNYEGDATSSTTSSSDSTTPGSTTESTTLGASQLSSSKICIVVAFMMIYRFNKG
jgi:hypothetical protein